MPVATTMLFSLYLACDASQSSAATPNHTLVNFTSINGRTREMTIYPKVAFRANPLPLAHETPEIQSVAIN